MSEEYEYEYEEVTDYKKIALIVVPIVLVTFIGLIYLGIIPNTTIANISVGIDWFPEQIGEITQPNKPVTDNVVKQEQPNQESTEGSTFDIEPEISSIPDEPTINEKLLKEFISFGLTEEEITSILLDDCENYKDGFDVEPKFELLATAKTELCFGAIQGDENESG